MKKVWKTVIWRLFYHSTCGGAIVRCVFPANPTAVRLVGGNSSREGRLEVYYRGRWGTVCDDYFDDTDARVACFSLGFGSAAYYICLL